MNKAKIRSVLQFIQDTYSKSDETYIKVFFTRNIVGDYMVTVFENDKVTIDYAPNWWYVEVFGLTEDEVTWIEDNVLDRSSRFVFTQSWETKLKEAKV